MMELQKNIFLLKSASQQRSLITELHNNTTEKGCKFVGLVAVGDLHKVSEWKIPQNTLIKDEQLQNVYKINARCNMSSETGAE